MSATIQKSRDSGRVEYAYPFQREWLTDEQIDAISPTGAFCDKCSAPISKKLASLLLENFKQTCETCGKTLSIKGIDIKISADKNTYAAKNVSKIYQMKWFHSSIYDHFEKRARQSRFYVHLGSEQAAIDRRLGVDFDKDGILMPTRRNEKGFWLYEARIKKYSTVSSIVENDSNGRYNRSGDGPHHRSEDVIRYLNRWEDMGSISVAVWAPKLTIVNKTFYTYEDACRTLSLENINPIVQL